MFRRIFAPLHLRSFFNGPISRHSFVFSLVCSSLHWQYGYSTVLAIANLQASTRTDYSPGSLYENGQEEGAPGEGTRVPAPGCCRLQRKEFPRGEFQIVFHPLAKHRNSLRRFHSGRRRSEHTQPEDYFYFRKVFASFAEK